MSHKVIEGAKMHVDTDNNHHVGYLLGRLFAVIEYAQQRGKDGSEPIRAQMLGTASAIPQRVFPDLFRLYYRCATEIEGRNEGLAKRLEAIFDEISVGLKSGQGIPGNLNVEEQCQFFSGYRLQRIDLNLPY